MKGVSKELAKKAEVINFINRPAPLKSLRFKKRLCCMLDNIWNITCYNVRCVHFIHQLHVILCLGLILNWGAYQRVTTHPALACLLVSPIHWAMEEESDCNLHFTHFTPFMRCFLRSQLVLLPLL